MGCYIYSVRKTKPVIVQHNGAWHDVLRLAYLYKPTIVSTYTRYGRPRGSIGNMLVGKAFAVWEGHDLTGQLVVHCTDEPTTGCHVYRLRKHTPVWDDCGDNPGEHIGYLEEFGRDWRIVNENPNRR